MIDVSQWRASIGLWNYCQAASSRLANGRHSHLFKAAVDSKSGSTTSGDKTSKLPAALPRSLIALLLLFLFLLRHILMIPSAGNCYQLCTTGVTVDMNYHQSVVLPRGSSSNLIYNDLYLIVCLRMLLLLSGDVELNPGPTIDDQPNIRLLTQWLDPLVDWKRFGIFLPGILDSDILKIEAENATIDDRKFALCSKWLSITPRATWADVINALKNLREKKLVELVKEKTAPRSTASSTSQKKEVMFRTAREETEILCALLNLKKEFSLLMTQLQLGLEKKKNLHGLNIWLGHRIDEDVSQNSNSLHDTFNIIRSFYDFIDCSLIVEISENFLEDFEFGLDELSIVNELKNYKKKADNLIFSAPVDYLHKSIEAVYEKHADSSSMPIISLKFYQPRVCRGDRKLVDQLIRMLLPPGSEYIVNNNSSYNNAVSKGF